jgi:Putative prokaryotic signal transducing protein
MAERLVTMATFDDPIAAAMAKNYLESEGIPAILLDESSVATDWLLSNAIGGIKLQVFVRHVERAEFLLDRIPKKLDDDDEPLLHHSVDPEASIEWRTKQQEIAEELRAEQIDQSPCNLLVDRLFRATVLGFLFFPLHFYAIWLLLDVFVVFKEIEPQRRWKVWFSLLCNIPLIGCVVAGILCFWKGPL